MERRPRDPSAGAQRGIFEKNTPWSHQLGGRVGWVTTYLSARALLRACFAVCVLRCVRAPLRVYPVITDP